LGWFIERLCLSAVCVVLEFTGAVSLSGISYAQEVNPLSLNPKTPPPVSKKTQNQSGISSQGYGRAGNIEYKKGLVRKPLSKSNLNKGGKIEVNQLSIVTPDAVGVLRTEVGGLGEDMWEGISLDTAERLFDHLPSRLGSPVLADLVRRVSMTAAKPPEGQSNGEQLAVRRVSQLIKMADYASALSLLSVMPRQGRGAGLKRVEAELKLLTGDQVGGCSIVRDEVRRNSGNFWQKALVFCQLVSGQEAQAELGISMLREVGVEDVIFFQMVDAMSQDLAYQVSKPEKLNFFSLLMLSRIKLTLTPDIIENLPAGATLALAVNSRLPAEVRLSALEQAAQMGLLSDIRIKRLFKDIYEQLPPPAEAEKIAKKTGLNRVTAGNVDKVSKLDTDSNTVIQTKAYFARIIKRARLLATSIGTPVPAVKAEAAFGALVSAHADGVFAAWAGLFRDDITTIEPTSDYIWFAPHALRASLANGQHERAIAWGMMLHRGANRNKEGLVLLENVQMLAEFVRSVLKAEPQASLTLGPQKNDAVLNSIKSAFGYSASKESWLSVNLNSDGDNSLLRVAPVPPTLWLALLDLNDRQNFVDQSNRISVKIASEKGKLETVKKTPIGNESKVAMQQLETLSVDNQSNKKNQAVLILLIARIIGSANPSYVHPVLLRQVIYGLDSAGFNDEAKRLSIEAMLGAGY
tara:strand:+ start:2268 stop:4340 length:2073 start_codon:yes stop_codon:yes gene_type:complete